MNHKEHLTINLLSTVPFALLLYFAGWFDYIYYLVPMVLVSSLPDVIEPAKHYTHRKFFHSKRVLVFLSKYVLPSFFILGIFWRDSFYLFFGVLGYIVHLLADSTTKMGLPK